MKRGLSIFLVMCLLGILLTGCSTKGNISATGNATSSNTEEENSPVSVNDSHTPIVSSTFELNGVRFWCHDDVEIECLVLEELQLAEITLNGTMLHVDVYDKEDQSDWYDNTVNRGEKTASTSGDVCYRSDTGLMWEIATESGKLIVLYGDSDSGDDWKEIGQMLEWTVIDADHSSTEDEYPNTGFTIKDGLFEPTNGVILTPAGQPLTLGNITISEVLLSDAYDYRKYSENPDLEESACYDFDMISTSYDGDEWIMAPFLSYLVPSDATITFYPSEDNMSFWFDGYHVFAEEGSNIWKQTRVGGFKATADDMEPVVFTLDDFKKILPDLVCLSCSTDGQIWYGIMFVS